MAVQEVESDVIELDRPLEDLDIEELERLQNGEELGETEQSEPEDDPSEEVAEVEEDAEEPVQEDDSIDEEAKEESVEEIVKAMRKEMAGLQKAYAKSQTELGGYRKLAETIQNLEKSVQSRENDDEEIDPYVDPEKFLDRKLTEREQRESAARQAQELQLQDRKHYVESKVPEFSEIITDMTDELKSVLDDDPNVDVYTENFKNNPYLLDELTLVALGKAAKYKREIAELKGKADGSVNGKKDLIKKVNNLTRSKSKVNGGSNASSNSVGRKLDLSPKQIENASIEELEKLYSQSIEEF